MSKLAHSNQETMDLIEAHRLAHELGWREAKEIARVAGRRGRGHKPTAADYFDRLAATCLGDLIQERMRRPRKRKGGK